MSSPSVQRLIRPCVISESLLSCPNSPNLSISSRGEVHTNGAFDSHEGSGGSLSDFHEYDSIRTAQPKGPRKKTNFIYEQAIPSPSLPHRALRQDSESPWSRSSSSSSSSTDDSSPKRGRTHLSMFVVFLILVIFVISIAALGLVILTINGAFGPKCVCSDEGNFGSPNTGMSGDVTVQSLLRRIENLEKNMLTMKAKMQSRDSLVQKQENQVKFLQNQVSAQGRIINETAPKVDSVDCSTEKNLTTEIKLLNKTANALKNSDDELTSAVNGLRQNHTLAKQTTYRLAVSVKQLQLHVQELRNLSARAENLERGYVQITSVINSLQAVNGAQNASHQALQSGYNRLENSITAVNAILKNKLNSSAAANFSSCEHRMIEGAPSTSGSGALSSVSYHEPPNRRVLGIACSTDFAEEYKLAPQTVKGLYRCSCSGLSQPAQIINQKKIKCYLHLWECQIND